jgi:glycerophosphoryl diester phosphodiesterase
MRMGVIMAALVLAGGSGAAPALEIVAHRGASADAPENTLASVKLAWEQSADAVEIDVRLTKDGKLAVIHDEDTRRVAGKPGQVRGQTLAELRALDVGRWKDAKWAGEKIPTLDEVLAAMPDGRKLFVEMKCGAEAVGELKKAIAASSRKPEQVTIIGFSLPTMEAAKRELPGHPVSWLVEVRKDKASGKWQPDVDELVEKARKAGLDGLSLNATAAIDAELVRKLHAAGLKLNVWTVDSAEVAKRLEAAGVDHLTTNRPGWMREKLGLKGPDKP